MDAIPLVQDVMSLSRNDRLLLSQTTARTDMGQLLRRYWYPVAVASELTEAEPIQPFRLLSEDFVVFRDKLGRLGCVPAACPHAQGDMALGYVEERGIVCTVHGWMVDVEGNCYPGYYYREHDQASSWAKSRACPVREHLGLLWVYLGDGEAPEFPDFGLGEVSALPSSPPPGGRGPDEAARGRDEAGETPALPASGAGVLRVHLLPIQQGNWLVEHSNALYAWRWHATTGGRLPNEGEATFVAPTHLQVGPPHLNQLLRRGKERDGREGAYLWLRAPVDQNKTWQARVDLVPGAAPHGAVEVVRVAEGDVPPPADDKREDLSFYSVGGDVETVAQELWGLLGKDEPAGGAVS